MKPESILVPIYLRIGDRLRTIRISRNEKMETVERATGINHSVISKIENGRYDSLSYKMLARLVSYYQVPLDQITTP